VCELKEACIHSLYHPTLGVELFVEEKEGWRRERRKEGESMERGGIDNKGLTTQPATRYSQRKLKKVHPTTTQHNTQHSTTHNTAHTTQIHNTQTHNTQTHNTQIHNTQIHNTQIQHTNTQHTNTTHNIQHTNTTHNALSLSNLAKSYQLRQITSHGETQIVEWCG
jgi:hypothetical protein